MSRDLELSSRVLPAGASSYYHDSDNDGGDRGRGSTTQPALFDISSSQSQGSLSNDHEHQKPPLSVEVENKANNSDKTTAGIIADSIDSSKNFLYRMSINHGDIGFRGESLIDFKNGGTGSGSFMNGKGSLLSFEQNHQVWIHQPKSVDDSSIWKHDGDNIMSGAYVDHHLRQVTPASDPKGCSSSSHIPDLISNHSYYQQGKSSYGWLYSDSTVVAADRVQEAGLQERTLFKRPYMGDQSAQPSKKRCTTVAKSPSSKPNKLASTKDPQSIAAKNRRERISERLKLLQELVPNGPKVDLVTMLDKAISYVKFLQLQVKVLATDEFWPAQGGKAPDIAQVKEAIDAILTSQRERSSSSK